MATSRPTQSTSSAADEPNGSAATADPTIVGSVTPRLWTPPLVDELTPETSYGFDVIDFAEVMGHPLDLWQQWLAIHLGELLPDGRPRFRVVLALVARQNGKSLLAKILILYWLAIERVGTVLGTSTDRTYAKLAWRETCQMADDSPWLDPFIRKTTGEEALIIGDYAYHFAANSDRAGRSLTLARWVCDELREHDNFETWGAATNAMNAVPHGQVVAITNQGDNTAVVLDSLRDSALNYIETGDGDYRLGLFEWSSPNGAEPTDVQALAMANPNLGHRVDVDSLVGAAARAVKAGGEELASFRTEVMCQRVHMMDAAIDEHAWADCGTDEPVDLAEHRDRVALCFDVALDGSHATAYAAATIGPHTHVDVVEAWEGHGCISQLKRELPGIVAKVKPRKVGWFPKGPSAALAAELRAGWAPRGTEIEEITSDLTVVCMGMAEQVNDRAVIHAKDPLLTAHVTTAQKLRRGDAWVFTRRGSGAVDAAYAAAGAVHLARTLPPPKSPLVAL